MGRILPRSPRPGLPPVVLAVAMLAGGCASAGPPPAPAFAGDVEAAPDTSALPSAERARYSERMRFGLTLARESLAIPDPQPPDRHELALLESWASESLRPWLERKSHTVEAAREELDAAAEENHRQRIVAGAVVGLIYEDVGRGLRRIPLPDALEDDPEAAQLFDDVLDGQAAPFLRHARRAYEACAQNARHPDDMEHWSPFCAGRADRLPLPEPSLAPGETEVQVIADAP